MLRPEKHLPKCFQHTSVKKFHFSLNEEHPSTYPRKVRVSGLDMEVGEIEHNPMGKITEATVVDNQSFPSIDHL